MGGSADDDRKSPLCFRLTHQAVDAFDKGAGGIDDLRPGAFQPLIHLPADTVGADHHRVPGPGLLRRIDDPDTGGGKLLHDMAVVDDGPQGQCPLSRRRGLLHQLHRPADTEAEAGAFGNPYTHRPNFSPMIFFMAAMTWSMVMSEVSSFTESRVIFRGAMSRWVSW